MTQTGKEALFGQGGVSKSGERGAWFSCLGRLIGDGDTDYE